MTTNGRTMQNAFDTNGLLDALAEKVTVRLRAELKRNGIPRSKPTIQRAGT